MLWFAIVVKFADVVMGLLLSVTDVDARLQVGLSALQSFKGADASAQLKLTCPVNPP